MTFGRFLVGAFFFALGAWKARKAFLGMQKQDWEECWLRGIMAGLCMFLVAMLWWPIDKTAGSNGDFIANWSGAMNNGIALSINIVIYITVMVVCTALYLVFFDNNSGFNGDFGSLDKEKRVRIAVHYLKAITVGLVFTLLSFIFIRHFFPSH